MENAQFFVSYNHIISFHTFKQHHDITYAPAIDVNTPSVLAALPIIAKKKKTLYFYNNSQHAAAVGKIGKTGDEVLHLDNCSTKAEFGVCLFFFFSFSFFCYCCFVIY